MSDNDGATRPIRRSTPTGTSDQRVEAAAEPHRRDESRSRRLMAGSVGATSAWSIALVLLCIVGVITAGDRFADTDNLLTILRLASVIGVVSIGMTFVITGGGIDLSVGAVVGLASVWATTLATQTIANDVHWLVMVFTALAGRHRRRADQRRARRLRPDRRRSSRRWPCWPRPAASPRSSPTGRPRSSEVNGFLDFFTGDLLGIPVLVWIFALVAVIGWVLLNRTTFGRRTFAVGGNPEAARLAGIRVKRHTLLLYVLVGLCLRHRRGDDHGPHRRPAARRTARSTSSTRSPPSSSAAPCSPAAAARSSAPSSAC